MNRAHHIFDGEREELLQLHGETMRTHVRSQCDMLLLLFQGVPTTKIGEREQHGPTLH